MAYISSTGRSATLKGATGAAFGLAFQNCVGQVGGVIGPQLFQAKYASNGYKTPFSICAGAVAGAYLASIWTWWLTRKLEWKVRKTRRLRAKAERENVAFPGDETDEVDEKDSYSEPKTREV